MTPTDAPDVDLPPLPPSDAWNCQLVMNEGDGIVEGWFTTKPENDPDDIPNGWNARIERVPVFNHLQMQAYALQAVLRERERCAKLADDMDYGMGELAAAIRGEKK